MATSQNSSSPTAQSVFSDVKQLIKRGQSEVLANLTGEKANMSSSPDASGGNAQGALSQVQKLIERGQNQVLANLEKDNKSLSSDNSSGLFFGSGNSGSDTLTRFGQGDSSSPKVSFELVNDTGKEGSISTTGLNQVNITIDGEKTPLFSFGMSGSTPSSSSSDSVGIGGAIPSFLTNTQPIGGTSLA